MNYLSTLPNDDFNRKMQMLHTLIDNGFVLYMFWKEKQTLGSPNNAPDTNRKPD